MKEEICECIKSSSDKELLLIYLDENKRNEGKEIIKLRAQKENILRSHIIDIDEINNLERLAGLHEERIYEIKTLIHKIENTIVC